MTDQEIAEIGPAFGRYLQGYRDCFDAGLRRRLGSPPTGR